MPDTDKFANEVLLEHASLIHRIVMHCNDPASVADLATILQQAENNGWERLVSAVRNIISGEREESILHGLDEEEAIIIGSILNGLEDPSTLPPLQPDFQSGLAAPGIAGLIHASGQGSTHSLNIIANLAKTMLDTGGDFAVMAGQIRPLIEGERDLAKLTENMTQEGQRMMANILAELARLDENTSTNS